MIVFIYCADLWCELCGESIAHGLTREGKAPADVDDQSTYDSGDFPKESIAGESDSPNHCAAGADCLSAITLADGSKVGAIVVDALSHHPARSRMHWMRA